LARDDLGPAAWSVNEMLLSRVRPRRARGSGAIPALRRFL